MKLVKMNDSFTVVSDIGIIKDLTVDEAIEMLCDLGSDIEEVYLAVDELITLGHDVADFGVAGNFIFSYAISSLAA